MGNTQRGKLILQDVPAGEVARRVVTLLSKFTKRLSIEELNKRVRNTPYALSNDIAEEKAVVIVKAIEKVGAAAVFVPHAAPKPTAEQFKPIESATTRVTGGLDFTARGGKGQRREVPPIVENNAVNSGAKPRHGGIWETQSEPHFTMSAQPLASEKPVAVQLQPQKDGYRRLVTFLISVLLLLSVAYLAYQLWPLIGDRVIGWVSTLSKFIQNLF